MKAATGELNLTLITVIALAALLALFTTVLLPNIRDRLTNQWDSTEDISYVEVVNTNLL